MATVLFGCGLGSDRESRVARVEASFEAGDYRAALVDLRNLVRDEPQNAQFRLQFAQALLGNGEFESAEIELRKARELGTAPELLTLPVAQSLVGQGKFQAALEQLSDPKLAESPDTTALQLRGQALLGLRRFSDARVEFEDAIARSPADTASRLGLVSALDELGDSGAAKAQLDKAVELAPEHLDAQVVMGSWHARAGQLELARSSFTKALALAQRSKRSGSEVVVLVALGETELALNQLESAERRLEAAEKLSPNAGPVLTLKARLAIKRSRLDEAQTALQQLLSRTPESRQGNLLMGAVAAAQGNLAQAEVHLEGAVSASPDSLVARKLLADVQLRQNRPDEALQSLGTPATAVDPDLLALAGRANVLLGDFATAIDYFKRGRQTAPDDASRTLDLAAAYLVGGRAADALTLLRALPADDASLHRREMLFLTALLATDRREEAISEARAFAAAHPKDDEGLLVAARGLLVAKDAAGARALVTQVTQLTPDEARAWVALGLLEWTSGDRAAASAAFDRALRLDADNLAALMGKAHGAAADRDIDSAIQHFEKARRISASAVQPRISLARLYLSRGDVGLASAALAEARKLRPKDPEVRALTGLALLAQRQATEATAMFEDLVGELPNQATLLAALARAYLMDDRMPDAREANTRALKADPNYWPALVFETTISIDAGDLAGAAEHLGRLRKAQAPNSVVQILEADLAMRRGAYADAARLYATANAATPTPVLALKEYAARRAMRAPERQEPLRTWLDRDPNNVSVRLMLAQDFQDSGNRIAAIGEYETILRQTPGHAVAQNNLAWLKLESGDIGSALALAKNAYAASPKVPEVADTYGWALVQSGKHQEAVPVLKAAHSAASGNSEVQYHLAVALLRSGSKEEARTHLEALVHSAPPFSSSGDVRALLESMRTKQDGTSRDVPSSER
ncbi:MAG: XrtA/PEP-CTERM system TPR-repeat protein PrsT [Gammaproteobacteria bacterium]